MKRGVIPLMVKCGSFLLLLLSSFIHSQYFLLLFFVEIFGAASLQIRFVCSSAKFAESNYRSRLFVKKYPISKKIYRLNQSPDEGDIADLKSALLFKKNCDGRTVAARI